MARFVDRLRSGAWLTRERMWLVALAVLTRNGWPRELARQPISSAERA